MPGMIRTNIRLMKVWLTYIRVKREVFSDVRTTVSGVFVNPFLCFLLQVFLEYLALKAPNILAERTHICRDFLTHYYCLI
jgi:hypothetical protein